MSGANPYDPFEVSEGRSRRAYLYVVSWQVYRSWLELAANGLNGASEDWDGYCNEKIACASDDEEAFHWEMVWEFGLRYGSSKRDAVEINGHIFREPEYSLPEGTLYIADDEFQREVIADVARAGQTQVYRVSIKTSVDP